MGTQLPFRNSKTRGIMLMNNCAYLFMQLLRDQKRPNGVGLERVQEVLRVRIFKPYPPPIHARIVV